MKMKVEVNNKIREALLDSINVSEVFSEEKLERLTLSIIADEYEDLYESLYIRDDEEIFEMFKGQVEDIENYADWSEARKDLFLESQSRAWGVKTLGFSIREWVAHFADYIDYEYGAWEEYEAFLDKIDKMTEIEILI